MTELNTWAENGPTRQATALELDGGFECGPGDRDLFNWMFQQLLGRLELLDGAKFYRSALAIQNEPPVSPAKGEAWIVGTTPTGDWIGRANSIAEWSGVGWRFITPASWMLVGLPDRTDWRWDDTLATPAWVRWQPTLEYAGPVTLNDVRRLQPNFFYGLM